MASHTHLEWLNRNSLRSYPLRDDQLGKAVDGWELPSTLLVDARLAVPQSAGIIGVQSVFVSNTLVSINLCDESGDSLATAVFARGQGSIWTSTYVHALQSGVAGTLSIGPAIADGLQLGHHVFATPVWLEPSCTPALWPVPVTSLSVAGNPVVQPVPVLNFAGDIQAVVTNGYDGDGWPCFFVTLQIDPKKSANYQSLCQPVTNIWQCGKDPILSLSGVAPNSGGQITIEFSGFSQISTTATAILPSKTGTNDTLCSKPQMPAADGTLPIPVST